MDAIAFGDSNHGRDSVDEGKGRQLDRSYDLDPQEVLRLEAELVNRLEEADSLDGGLAAVIAATDTKAADLARTLECQAFPGYDFSAAMAPYEAQSRFILTVDLEATAVVHCKRVVTCYPEEQRRRLGLTGIEIIDDRLGAANPAERLDLQSILVHHKINSLAEVLNVTTNFATRRELASRPDRPYTLVSYKAVYELTRLIGADCIIAYLNDLARTSLARLGVEWELLGGSSYHLPNPGEDTYDLDYEAVVIPDSAHNLDLFEALSEWRVPMLWLDASGSLKESTTRHDN